MVFRAASSGALQSSALAVLSLILTYALDRSVGSFVLVLIFLGLGSWRITRSLFRARTWLDAILISLVIGSSWIMIIAEIVSLFGQFGHPMSWLIGSFTLCVVSLWLPIVTVLPRPIRRSIVPESLVGRAALAAIGAQLLLVCFTTFFTGINVQDSIGSYLPRSVRYVQNGTMAIYDTHYDYLPAFHQILVSIQLLYLKSDILV